MSYCRFEGTRRELAACLEEAQLHADGNEVYAVSKEEIEEFRSMMEEIVDFLHVNELLDEDGHLDVDALDLLCEQMERGN